MTMLAPDRAIPDRAIPGDGDVVIVPGSKSTRGDLAFLRAQGWDAGPLRTIAMPLRARRQPLQGPGGSINP